MQRVTHLKTDRQESNPEALVERWKLFLQEQDHSPGTVKKYTQALAHFLAWSGCEGKFSLAHLD